VTEELFQIREPSPAQATERDRVLALLHDLFDETAVREVGSTAVDGVIGKEDVDILVLTAPEAFAAARSRLDGLFSRDEKQLSTEIYQGYRASSDWDVAIQLTVDGSPHDVFDPFLDALRTNSQLRQDYNALKRQWNGRSMAEYRAAKAEFIGRALALELVQRGDS